MPCLSQKQKAQKQRRAKERETAASQEEALAAAAAASQLLIDELANQVKLPPAVQYPPSPPVSCTRLRW